MTNKNLGFTLIEFGIVLLILALILVIPEWFARDEVTKSCEAIKIGDGLSVVKSQTPFLNNKMNYFTCGFDEKTQSGSLVHLARGAFPFGRDFCVITIDSGVVKEKHTVYGDIDYDCDKCKKDMRPIVEIEPQCDWSGV